MSEIVMKKGVRHIIHRNVLSEAGSNFVVVIKFACPLRLLKMCKKRDKLNRNICKRVDYILKL